MTTETRVCRWCSKKKPSTEFRVTTQRAWKYMEGVCKACYAIERQKQAQKVIDHWHELKALGQLHTEFRRCGRCKETKTLEYFAPSEYRCRICNRDKSRKHRIASGRYAVAVNVAKRRKLPFPLSREQYATLILQPCRYCDGSLSSTGMSLDRINSSREIGYTIDNAVPCCEHCNRTKADVFTFEEMLIIGAAIRDIRKQRAESGKPDLKSGAGRPRFSDDEHGKVP